MSDYMRNNWIGFIRSYANISPEELPNSAFKVNVTLGQYSAESLYTFSIHNENSEIILQWCVTGFPHCCGAAVLSNIFLSFHLGKMSHLKDKLKLVIWQSIKVIKRSLVVYVATPSEQSDDVIPFIEEMGMVRHGPFVENPNTGNSLSTWIMDISEIEPEQKYYDEYDEDYYDDED